MSKIEIIIIEIGEDRVLLEKCLEKIYFRLHSFGTFLENSEVITGKIQKEKKRQLQIFDTTVHETYYLKIGIMGEIISVTKEEIITITEKFVLTAEQFLAAKFLEKES